MTKRRVEMTKLDMKIRKLNTDNDFERCYKIFNQLYTGIGDIRGYSFDEYKTRTLESINNGYNFLVAEDGDKILAFVGYSIDFRFYCGKYLHVHNLVVDEEIRKSNVATDLLNYLKGIAKDNKCETVLADCYNNNFGAHKFFHKNDFHIRGFHLKCDL